MTVVGEFLGLLTLDLEYLVETLPMPDEKVVALQQEVAAGGPAANAAKTFAALGGTACLITLSGKDHMGQLARRLLADSGVRLSPASQVGGSQAVSSVLVERANGRRAVVSINASAVQLPISAVESRKSCDSRVLMIDGHHGEAALVAARSASSDGTLVVMDGGSWKPGTDSLLPFVSWIICSSRFSVPGVRLSKSETLAALLAAGVTAAAITDGDKPIVWATKDGSGELSVRTSVETRDTLGAGDVFHGAMAFAAANGKAFVDALAEAAEIATASTEWFGLDAWLRQLATSNADR